MARAKSRELHVFLHCPAEFLIINFAIATSKIRNKFHWDVTETLKKGRLQPDANVSGSVLNPTLLAYKMQCLLCLFFFDGQVF
jgi:hypothetical protein